MTAIGLIGWALLGVEALTSPYAASPYAAASSAARAQYEQQHGLTGLTVSRGLAWDRCAVVELDGTPDPGTPVTVIMSIAYGQWVLAGVSSAGAYFDTDDVSDEPSCLSRVHKPFMTAAP